MPTSHQKYQISLAEIIGLLYLVLVILAAGSGIFIYAGGLSFAFIGWVLLLSLLGALPSILIWQKFNWRETLKHLLYLIGIGWPLLLLTFNYVNLKIWKTPSISLLDKHLLKIDQFLFGGINIHIWLGQFHLPILETWLAISYLFYFLLYLIVPVALYQLKNNRVVRDLVLSVSICSYLAFFWYHFWPAIGPWRFYSGDYATALTTPMTKFLINFVQNFGNGVDAMPSLHAGITAIFMYYLFKYRPKLAWWLLPLMVSIYPATIYLRWHYVIDIIAGITLALLTLWLTPKLNDWWFGEKKS